MQSLDLYFGFSLLGVVMGLGAAIVLLILGIPSLMNHKWFNVLNGVDKLVIPLMLWPGLALLAIGYYFGDASGQLAIPLAYEAASWIIKFVNGLYLTFIFAPVIRKREEDGKSTFLTLPMPHRYLIFISGSIAGLVWGASALILWLEITHLY